MCGGDGGGILSPITNILFGKTATPETTLPTVPTVPTYDDAESQAAVEAAKRAEVARMQAARRAYGTVATSESGVDGAANVKKTTLG